MKYASTRRALRKQFTGNMLKALEYLTKERKLTEEAIQQFGIGYCDPHGTNYLWSDFPTESLSLDTRFFNSILFPIKDLYGSVIAISARSMDPDPKSKYLNTSYTKGKHLYGLYQTWKSCLEQNKVYVVEGNIDVPFLWQSGVPNVVGMLGSNLTVSQLCLLRRFTTNICLVPDADKAGTRFLDKVKIATSKKYENLEFNYSIIILPDGLDPDEYLLTHSKEEFYSLEMPLEITLKEKLGSLK